jgi:hypothetical protein
MKRFRICLTALAISVFALFCGFVLYPNTLPTAEASVSSLVSSTNYYSTYNLDYPLFQALLSLENEVTNGNDTGFSSSFFSGTFADYTPTSTDGVSIKTDLTNGILDLQTAENASYTCLEDNDAITSIIGLKNLQLDGITTLILDGNAITYIYSSDLSSLTDLNVLSANENGLKSFATDENLSALYLRDNDLSSIDLSSLAQNAVVDLAGNLIEDIADITFSSLPLNSLDLAFNNITGGINLSSLQTRIGCTPVFLVQGLNKTSFTAGDSVAVVYNSTTSVVANVKYSSTSAFSGNLESSGTTSGVNVMTLPAGKIDITFTFSSTAVENLGDDGYLSSMSISSKMPAPTVTATVDGSVVASYSQNSPTEFSFAMNVDNSVVNLSTIVQNAEIYSGLNGSEKKSVSTYSLSSVGFITLKAYYVFDGIDGNTLVFDASYTKASNTALSLVLMVIIFVAIATVIYLINWFRNGAPMVSLTTAEVLRERRRQERKMGRSNIPLPNDFGTYTNGSQNENYTQNYNNNYDDEMVDLSGKDKENDNENVYNNFNGGLLYGDNSYGQDFLNNSGNSFGSNENEMNNSQGTEPENEDDKGTYRR